MPVAQPLMPHATASWLVENSALTLEQIAEFCGLHILEIQAIADDTAATKLTGRDPIRAGELTQEEINLGQDDPEHRPRLPQAPPAASAPGRPPLRAGELTQEEITRGQADPESRLRLLKEPDAARRSKGPRY